MIWSLPDIMTHSRSNDVILTAPLWILCHCVLKD